MQSQTGTGALLILVTILAAGHSGLSHANSTFCTAITSLPTVINKSGVYCLKRDLAFRATTGAAIDIRRNNVVLDLNGFRIFGTAALSNETVGVQVSNKQKVRITGGTIERFRVGILLDRGIANSIDNVHLDQIRQFGVLQSGSGKSLKVLDNTVSRTGGGTSSFITGNAAGNNAYSAAMVIGDTSINSVFGSQVEGNAVFDIRSVNNGLFVIGILMLADNGVIKNNVVSGRELSFGIVTGGANSGVHENNVASETNVGTGIRFANSTNSVYTNNTVLNFSTAFSNGINGGGNVSAP